MQRTDDSGRAYGEGPYGGAGYAYAHGHEYGDSAQWAQPDPHLDVLTVPPPGFGAAGPPLPEWDVQEAAVQEPAEPANESVRPVFVDSSGRRQRRVLRAARLLVIPAGGYVALLISTLLGGPSINSPFVPQPDSPHRATPRATASHASPGTGRSARGASQTEAQRKPGPGAQKTSGPSSPPTPSAAPAATSGPTAAPTASAPPASAATHAAAPTPKGRAVGSSHNPVK